MGLSRAPCRRRPGRRLILALLAAALAAALWMGGPAGYAITHWAAPRLLPAGIGPGLVLQRLDHAPADCPSPGILLTISPGRARRLAEAATPWARLLPRGLLHEGLVLRGLLRTATLADAPGLPDVPLLVAIRPTPGDAPVLSVRAPAPLVNRLLREEAGDALDSRDDYALGDYRLVYKPQFETLHLRTTDTRLPDPTLRRHIAFEATGSIRLRFEDSLARITTDGRVKRLAGRIALRILREGRAYRLWYDADLTALDVNFKNVQNGLDRMTSAKLERALEKTLDRRRNKQRLLKKVLLPSWTPVDLALDCRLTPPPP